MVAVLAAAKAVPKIQTLLVEERKARHRKDISILVCLCLCVLLVAEKCLSWPLGTMGEWINAVAAEFTRMTCSAVLFHSFDSRVNAAPLPS